MPGRGSCATVLGGVLLVAALAACSVTPRREAQPAPSASAVAHTSAAEKTAAGDRTAAAGKTSPPGAGQAAAGPPPVPAEAKEEFDKALALVRAGNGPAAEAQFTSVAHQYPQFCTPLVDLGILYRKSGNLDAALQPLQQAVARDPHNAPAWTELGVTQRLGGKFKDAEQSYERAIAADPAYAPAYRDRGVLRDLYLDEPAAALADFEQYRKLAADDKPAAMWVAELQHRTGIKAPPVAQPPTTAGVAVPPPAARAGATPAPPPQARN